MKHSLQLRSELTRTTLWLAAHPAAFRVALVALPVAIALMAALFGHDPAFACPLTGFGSGCGGE